MMHAPMPRYAMLLLMMMPACAMFRYAHYAAL